jgi:hypothetical protein
MKTDDKLDGIPLLIEPEGFFKHALILRELDQVGYLNVEITNKECLKKLKIPAAVYHFASETNTPIEDMLNIIVRDWCIRMFEGESKYRRGLLYKILKAPENVLNDDQKNKLISYLHRDIPELKRNK